MPTARPVFTKRPLVAALMVLVALVACQRIMEPDLPGVPVVGSWRYSGRQTVPADADLTGTLSVTGQTGAQISGALDFIETDTRGLQRRVAGLLLGRTIDSTTLDFDVSLTAVTRRHVGRVVGDSIVGTWIEQPAGGSAPTASGTFRGARVR